MARSKKDDSKPPLRKAFARRLRALRIAAGYELQQEFADEAGIAPGTYSTYENATREPDITTMTRIWTTLECEPNDLLLPRKRKAPGKSSAKRTNVTRIAS